MKLKNIADTFKKKMYNATTRSYNGKRIASRELYRYHTKGRSEETYRDEKEMLDRVKLNEKIQESIVYQLQYSMLKHKDLRKENRQCDVCMIM